jgi:hypothetical protein
MSPTPRPLRFAVGFWAACWAAASGCSFAAVYGPAPLAKPTVAVSCTDERYAPALDVAAAAGALAGAIVETDKTVQLLSALAVVGWGSSAIYGYLTTLECMKAKDAAHRYETKLMLRQIDLLNEAASQHEAPAFAPPAPALEEEAPQAVPPESAPPAPIQ